MLLLSATRLRRGSLSVPPRSGVGPSGRASVPPAARRTFIGAHGRPRPRSDRSRAQGLPRPAWLPGKRDTQVVGKGALSMIRVATPFVLLFAVLLGCSAVATAAGPGPAASRSRARRVAVAAAAPRARAATAAAVPGQPGAARRGRARAVASGQAALRPAPTQAGLKAYRDPETGVLGAPPAGFVGKGSAAMTAAEEDTSRVVKLPSGAEMLVGGPVDYVILRLDANGRRVMRCVQDPKQAARPLPPSAAGPEER